MSEGLHALSEREKQTLRLLLGGHDAKSIARSLDLSVHTVNERLREARRKLGVPSSREAARQLAEMEQSTPNLFVDKGLGVAGANADRKQGGQLGRRNAGRPLLWLAGGMLIMSLIIAVAVLSLVFHGNSETLSPVSQSSVPDAAAPKTAQSPSTMAAAAWVALLDKLRWDESWDAAGALFRSQLPKTRWPSTIQPVRQPLGPILSRTLQSATKASSLPGAPQGDYEIVEFKTNFAQKRDAVETVVLAREGASWKVDGYFIR